MFSLSVFLWRRAAPDAFPPFLPLSLASLLVLTGLRFFSFGIITTPHNIVSTAAPTHLLYAVYLPTTTNKKSRPLGRLSVAGHLPQLRVQQTTAHVVFPVSRLEPRGGIEPPRPLRRCHGCGLDFCPCTRRIGGFRLCTLHRAQPLYPCRHTGDSHNLPLPPRDKGGRHVPSPVPSARRVSGIVSLHRHSPGLDLHQTTYPGCVGRSPVELQGHRRGRVGGPRGEKKGGKVRRSGTLNHIAIVACDYCPKVQHLKIFLDFAQLQH